MVVNLVVQGALEVDTNYLLYSLIFVVGVRRREVFVGAGYSGLGEYQE